VPFLTDVSCYWLLMLLCIHWYLQFGAWIFYMQKAHLRGLCILYLLKQFCRASLQLIKCFWELQNSWYMNIAKFRHIVYQNFTYSMYWMCSIIEWWWTFILKLCNFLPLLISGKKVCMYIWRNVWNVHLIGLLFISDTVATRMYYLCLFYC